METTLKSASIVEDQLFLLHNIQQISCQQNIHNVVSGSHFNLTDLFLSPNHIQSIFTQNFSSLMGEDVHNGDSIAVIVRCLCCCINLLKDVHGYDSTCTETYISTVQELDDTLCNIIHKWTQLRIDEIIQHCKTVLDFLVQYGGLHVIPDGVHPSHFRCFWCRFNSALCQDANDTVCTHYVTEKPKHTNSKNTTQTSQCDPETDDLIHDEELTVEARLNLREKKRKMNHTLQLMDNIQCQYKLYTSQREYMASLKQVSSFLYCLLGRALLFIQNRLRTVLFFSPSQGPQPIEYGFEMFNIPGQSAVKTRLVKTLKAMSLSKTSMRILHEQFEMLHLNPFSLFCDKEAMLRPSIIAKKVALSLGTSADDIVTEFKRRCSLKTEDVIGKLVQDPLDKMFYSVVTIAAYNAWLSCQFVRDSYEIKVCRSDQALPIHNTVSMLYDFCQIGFYLDNDLKFYGTCDQIIDVCGVHLSSLYNKGLCQTQTVKTILGI